MPNIISDIWSQIQRSLFPFLEDAFQQPLSEDMKRVVSVLETVRIEDGMQRPHWRMRGRPCVDRGSIARAFVAKAVLDVPTTKRLCAMLQEDTLLRRICGFVRLQDVPSEATLSRAFAEFASSALAQIVHAVLTDKHTQGKVIWNVSRDSTEIVVREKPAKKPPKEPKPKQKRGRKRKDDPPPEPTRLEKQRTQTPEEAFADLPTACDFGVKQDTHGKRHFWVGYKAHIDWADCGYPLAVVLTSASTHDSQVAIPMAKNLASKRTVFYEIMDTAYDANEIIEAIDELNHRPIIAIHSRRKNALPFDPATEERYKVRTVAERGNSRLKDGFGCRHIRVRGATKVLQHVMFGVLALSADVLLKMAVVPK
jgi:hypothetical protein